MTGNSTHPTRVTSPPPNRSATITNTTNSTNCTDISPDDQTMKISILSSLAFFILLSNILIIIVILSKKSKVSRLHFFLLHLSVADTSTALFTLLPEVIWSITIPEFHGGNLACKSIKFFQMLGPYLSSYTLCAMAWDGKQVGRPEAAL